MAIITKILHCGINKLPNLHFQILESLFILRERTFKTWRISQIQFWQLSLLLWKLLQHLHADTYLSMCKKWLFATPLISAVDTMKYNLTYLTANYYRHFIVFTWYPNFIFFPATIYSGRKSNMGDKMGSFYWLTVPCYIPSLGEVKFKYSNHYCQNQGERGMNTFMFTFLLLLI